MKKALVGLGSDEEEGKSERKVINQIFGRLLHPKNEVRYLENIFFRLKKRFLPIRGCFHKSYKSKYRSIYNNENFVPVLSVKNHPFTFFEFYTPLN